MRGDEFSLRIYSDCIIKHGGRRLVLICRILYYLLEVSYFEDSCVGGIIYFSMMLDLAPLVSLFS